jgi:hypothetical protein
MCSERRPVELFDPPPNESLNPTSGLRIAVATRPLLLCPLAGLLRVRLARVSV